jgi:hypothetical protein
MSIEHMFLM